jgi:CO dehydrogenase/acetyl-CoA synthase beta subunit
MGLFGETEKDLNSWLEIRRRYGGLRQYNHAPATWPREKSVVLQAETALELGNPLQASLSLLIWNEIAGRKSSDKVFLVGPDLTECKDQSIPLARLIMVQGDFNNEYDNYRDLMSAIYEVSLRGVTSRSLPSRHEVWLRISRKAMEKGLSLVAMGNALIERLKGLESVVTVQVVFVTDKAAISALQPIAEKAHNILDALVKMYDEMNFDCETCEYVEVCDEVVELKNIRDRLRRDN